MDDVGIGIGYTLATGRLFCSVAAFQEAAEGILGRSVWTHEMGSEEFWSRLRSTYEACVLKALA